MAYARLTFRLGDDLLDALDAHAEVYGLTRSGVVRQALVAALAVTDERMRAFDADPAAEAAAAFAQLDAYAEPR